MEPEKKQRKAYLGRKALLDIIMGKTDSTKKYLLKKIASNLTVKRHGAAAIRKYAKKMGIRVVKLEVK
jgi:hypothetical protein